MTVTPVFQPPGLSLEEACPTGDCPACGGIGIPLMGRRRLVPHCQHVVRKGRVVESDTPCDGGGGPTAEDLETPSHKPPTRKA